MTCLPSCTFRFLNVWANAPYGNNSVANRSPARKGDTMNGSSSSRLTIVRLHIHSPTHEALYDLETLARLAGVLPRSFPSTFDWCCSTLWWRKGAVNMSGDLMMAPFTSSAGSSDFEVNLVSTSTAWPSSWNYCDRSTTFKGNWPILPMNSENGVSNPSSEVKE